ncbi:MAG: thiamine pyrophosphate-binding protein [Acidobacteria bacterium]|nr:thiamine pyrophosphate-binding protein [Acidobacteriota bacterium]
MRELVAQYLSKSISRRSFVRRLAQAGVSLAAAEPIAQSLTEVVQAEDARKVTPDAVRIFQGNGAEAFAEQLIASGVKYLFGNSASEDAAFYEALVDRPQLTYILTPHEGPGAAMARGYIMASGQPAIAMQAAIVGLANAMGQMYNAYKEQTPLVFYSYRADESTRAGRDGFEEVYYQEQIVGPLTKWYWLARRPDMIPETVRRCFKAAWTPPYGPTYATWHSDYNNERVRAEVIIHEKVDPRMRVRPNPVETERAAKLLVEAEMPAMIVGDELYNAKAFDKAVKLAELLGIPVVGAVQAFNNFPEAHPLWVGRLDNIRPPSFQRSPDLVINVGNKLQHRRAALIIPRSVKLIDLRIDSASMGNVLTTDAPLVADVGLGLDDLIAAVESILTPTLKARATQRAEKVREFTERGRQLRKLVMKNPDWDQSPLLADRLTYEIAQFADKDALIVSESGGTFGFDFNPLGGRELFSSGGSGGHLGSGVGMAAGVKLARPDRQVIGLVGDGAFVFGPTALWNMARLELPVIVVVYNNHAYAGVHNRVIAAVPSGRMVETGQFVYDYLGKPDMNMAYIAKGFGVEGEVAESPAQLKEALARARKATLDGKPYLIDAQVVRTGVAWAAQPWTPTLQMARAGGRKA